MSMLHHMFCVLLTLTLLCVRVTSATNQHTLSVPSNINNTHSYSLIQGKLLSEGDGEGEMYLTPEEQKKKADELIKQFEEIVNATKDNITKAQRALEQAEAENIEAIKISSELQKIEGATEEEINASKRAYLNTYNNLTSAEGSFRLANGTLLSELERKLKTAKGQRAAITDKGEDIQHKNEGELRKLESQLSSANITATQIEDRLNEVMKKVKKVNEAFKDAQSIKAQVESKQKNKTPHVSSQSSVPVPQSQSNTGANSAQGINNPKTDSTQKEYSYDNRRRVTRENTNGASVPHTPVETSSHPNSQVSVPTGDSREGQQLRTETEERERDNNTTPSERNKNKNESELESKANTEEKDEITDLNDLSTPSIRNDMDGTNIIGWVPSLPIMFILLTVFPCVLLG